MSKVKLLVAMIKSYLEEQFVESAELEAAIRQHLRRFGL